MPPGAPTSALQARVEEKQAELEHVKEIRDMSATMAQQLEDLAGKMSLLANGTEALALVTANWNSVLQVIHMASSRLASPPSDGAEATVSDSSPPLPQTLVRIPTEHAPALLAQTTADDAEAGEQASV